MNDILEQIIEDRYPEYKALPIVDDIMVDENPRDDFWRDLSERETYEINGEFLKQTGDPKYDYLTCWEPGRLDEDNETLFDFPTLYEFDLAWWQFQKDTQYKSVEECKEWMEKGSEHWTPERVSDSINRLEEQYKDGYSIYCSGDWFRLIENDTFLYAQIISAKWYIYYMVENVLSELQDELIPYSFNEKEMDLTELLNEDDPKKKYLADGRELELESLKGKARDYEIYKLTPIIELYMSKYNYNGKTFRFDRGYTESATEKFDPFTDFIFWDEQSLKNVRTTAFLDDFSKVQATNELLTNIIDEISEKVKMDFMEIYDSNKSRFI